tara:strand:+ start:201 stop:779 length:579 start_codon:yes stop_codon:yes gene_type:complete
MKNLYFALGVVLILYPKQGFGAEAGMPQLNPEFWTAQIFWLILIFSSLYLIIWKIFLPRITDSIENRKSKVVNDLNETQKFKDDAEKKLNEYKNIIENAKKQARKIIEESRKKLNEDIEDKKQKFSKEIESELEAVEKEIKNLKKSSIANINKISIETSSEIIRQLVGTELNKSNVSAIVEDISKKRMEEYL